MQMQALRKFAVSFDLHSRKSDGGAPGAERRVLDLHDFVKRKGIAEGSRLGME